MAAPVATEQRVSSLRAEMAKANQGEGVHAYIVPSDDPHMSEYAPDCFARRQFISGFNGSAGTALVTTDKALLWTDGRYFLQASQELGPDWTLMKAGTEGVPEVMIFSTQQYNIHCDCSAACCRRHATRLKLAHV